MNTAGFIERIETLPGYVERPLPDALQLALRGPGVEDPYWLQAKAINAVRRGQHVIVASGTASGNTLAYDLPVLEALLLDGWARALYLFPTKALAQDQLRSLWELCKGGEHHPHKPRYVARGDSAQLHSGADFFANLHFVVIILAALVDM